MLWQRVITALVLVPPVLMGLIYGETQWVALITGIIITLGAWEWAKLANLTNPFQYLAYTLVIAGCLAGSYIIRHNHFAMYVVYLGACWWIVMSVLVINTEISKKLPQLTGPVKLISGIFTLVPSWLSLVLLHMGGSEDSRLLLIYLFILIWVADISGYFCGKKWGKHRIAPLVSPGKTWEGAIGAMVGCSILSFGFSINKQFQLSESIIFLLICLLIVMISIIGDLVESLFKRSANVKDSGNLLPGHGGVLDRIDSFTAASPVFLVALSLVGGIL